MKERLEAYREKELEIDRQVERLERLNSKIEGVGAQVITDMPHSPNTIGDRVGEMIGAAAELERSIEKAIEDQRNEKNAIESILKCLRRSDEKSVIRIRYFDMESWNMVNKIMFGYRDDFAEKEESYKRRAYRAHDAALLNMTLILEENQR